MKAKAALVKPAGTPSRALEKALVLHGMTFVGSEWRGLRLEQPFSCARGHITLIAPRNLIRQREQGCRACTRETATATAHTMATKSGSRWLDAPWRGTAARYHFLCELGHEWSCLGQPLLRGASCLECKSLLGNLPGEMLADGLERLRAAAIQRGGECLASAYDGVEAQYHFRCAEDHQFAKNGAAILYGGVWCPDCPRPRVLLVDGLERLQAAAREKGGVCLSTTFAGTAARHRFRCENGHVWSTFAGTILYSGGWCRRCQHESRVAPDGLARLREAAAAKGGVCLSKRYDGYHAKYQFRCAQKHRWKTSAQSVLRGSWCPKCAEALQGKVLLLADGLEQIKAAAAAHGGECLDGTYLGTARTYRFRCARQHEWKGKGSAILGGRWCKRCSDEAQRCTIDEAKAVAEARGGKCLSDVYANARAHLTWQCHRGHVWPASFDNVRNKGRWCPDCKVLNMISSARSKARARLRAGPPE